MNTMLVIIVSIWMSVAVGAIEVPSEAHTENVTPPVSTVVDFVPNINVSTALSSDLYTPRYLCSSSSSPEIIYASSHSGFNQWNLRTGSVTHLPFSTTYVDSHHCIVTANNNLFVNVGYSVAAVIPATSSHGE